MRYLRNKEMKEIKKISEKYGINIGKRLYEENNLIKGDFAVFFRKDDMLIPTLKADPRLPEVTVDMKAIAHVINGADIMRPGITQMDEFKKGDIVKVVDENNRKGLAIGIALFSSEEIKEMSKGKVIENIHYVGDSIWND